MAEIEPGGGAPDPAARTAAGPFEDHPLFPREDGSPETRDIQFVSFCRRRSGDGVIQNCPEDIPAREVKSWAQVIEWWGGGDYKAIAKDGRHRTIAWFPNTSGEWLVFDGASKPFTLRNGNGVRAPGPASSLPAVELAHTAPSAAPVAQDALLGVMTELIKEMRASRAGPPPAPNNDAVLVAMIEVNGKQAAAAAEAHAQMMQTMLNVVTQRPTESVGRPLAEPTTLALQLIGAVQKLVPAPVAQPGLAEQIPVIKALRDLTQPTAPTNELQPFVDMFGQVMAADAARTQAEAAHAQTTKRHEPPPTRPPPRPRPPLVHVPGVGMVEVVAPDASALRAGDMSIEERAAAIRKDPTLLRALGIGLPPQAIAPEMPGATAASPASPPAAPVGPAAALPAVPDLDPPPAPIVAATPPVSPPATPVVAAAPAEHATIAASPASPPATPSQTPGARVTHGRHKIERAAPPATPSPPPAVASGCVVPPLEDVVRKERPPIALPAQMPRAGPSPTADDDRQRAVGELARLASLTHEDRVAALRKLPGIGSMAEDVAHAMASLPPDAVAAMAETLDLDAIGALGGRSNGPGGR